MLKTNKKIYEICQGSFCICFLYLFFLDKVLLIIIHKKINLLERKLCKRSIFILKKAVKFISGFQHKILKMFKFYLNIFFYKKI